MSEIIIFICLLVLVIVVSYVVRKKSYAKNNTHYDERQLLVRAQASQISCYAVILINTFYAIFFYGITKDIVSPQIVVLTTAFIGIGVDVVYCILKDAYVQVGQNIKKWVGLMLIVIAANIFSASINYRQGIQENGFVTGFFINIIVTVLFSIILISMIVKSQIDKNGDEYEES